jgi:hypothetical protein
MHTTRITVPDIATSPFPSAAQRHSAQTATTPMMLETTIYAVILPLLLSPVLALKPNPQAAHTAWLKSLGPMAPPHQVKLGRDTLNARQRGQPPSSGRHGEGSFARGGAYGSRFIPKEATRRPGTEPEKKFVTGDARPSLAG